jgi:GTP:adenosylcobinamide-phosphate guanylyltransferase
VDAVVMAGSINRIPLFPGNRPGCKALVPICGRPMLGYVLDALSGARTVDRVLVIGGPEVRDYADRWDRVEALPEAGTLVDNAWLGLEHAHTDRVLYCNPDQPLLTPEMIDVFVSEGRALDADLVSSWASVETLGDYQAIRGKFARFADGTYCHGNLFLARRPFPGSQRLRRLTERLYAARKNALRYAWALGPLLLCRYVLARLFGRLTSLEETLDIVGKRFDVHLVPLYTPFPEVAFDVDEASDYALVSQWLAERLAAPRALNRTA